MSSREDNEERAGNRGLDCYQYSGRRTGIEELLARKVVKRRAGNRQLDSKMNRIQQGSVYKGTYVQ